MGRGVKIMKDTSKQLLSIEWDRYSIPLYEKLCSYQKPLDLSKQNFDYELPEFNPKVLKEDA